MSCLLCTTYYFSQGIPLPWQTKRTVFRDRPFPIIVVNKSTRRVLLYINLIGINDIIIIIIIHTLFWFFPVLPPVYVVLVLLYHVRDLNQHYP